MGEAETIKLLRCHICSELLKKHPLYDESVAKWCERHGDFFVQKWRGRITRIVFRSYIEYDRLRKLRKEKPKPKPAPLKKINAQKVTRPGNPGVKIRCDQTGDIFESVKDAGLFFNFNTKRIFSNLCGISPHVSGYSFTRVDTLRVDPSTIPLIPMVPYKDTCVRVRCEQTGEVFPSMRIAADKMKLNKCRISAYMTGYANHVEGYTFTRALPGEDSDWPYVTKPMVYYTGDRRPFKIYCKQTGETYSSLKDAARKTGFTYSTIRRNVINPDECPDVHGHVFVKVDESE